ncbi:MAG: hypothetical protein WA892_05240 [Ornithinimicrobium sp.]
MARSTQGRSRTAVGVILLAGGLSACGGQSQGTEAAQSPELAQVEPGDEIEPAQLLQRLSAPGTQTLSSFDFSADLDMDQQELAVIGGIDLDGDSPAAELTMDLPPMGTVDLLLVDDVAYLSIPNLTPAGKYVEVPASELKEMGVEDLTESLDVNALMKKWDASAQEITYVGEQDVNGETTDHFEVVVDPQEVLDRAGHTAPPELDVSGELTYGIWVDSDNLIRQMKLDIDGTAATVSLDNWGQDLQVEAPAPADVVQMPSF